VDPAKVPAPQGDPEMDVSTRPLPNDRLHTSVNLVKVGLKLESVRVSEGHVDDTMVGKGGHGGERSRLLSSTEAGGGDEDTGVLAGELSSSPELAGGVPKGLEHKNVSVSLQF